MVYSNDMTVCRCGRGRRVCNEICKHVCEISRSRSDIKDPRARMEKWKKVFTGMSMHVWCRNGGRVADTLGRVCIWVGGSIISTVDLRPDLIISFLFSFFLSPFIFNPLFSILVFL